MFSVLPKRYEKGKDFGDVRPKWCLNRTQVLSRLKKLFSALIARHISALVSFPLFVKWKIAVR